MEIFERKIYKELLHWKKTYKGTKALLIEGARRIGKSTIAELFGKKEYQSFILIDFSKIDESIKERINKLLSPNRLNDLFEYISYIFNKTLYKRKSLIIFDEIQAFPRAREAIKFLIEDGRYDYLETGSLLSIKQNVKNILIPSGEHRIKMYPMDFEEFLLALNKDNLISLIKNSLINKDTSKTYFYEEVKELFNKYLITGGLPEIVNQYIKTRNFHILETDKQDLVNLYLDDMNKFSGSKLTSRLFKGLPTQIGKAKFPISKIKSQSNGEEIINFLESSMLTNFCYRLTSLDSLNNLYSDFDDFKIYLFDTGIFLSLANDKNINNSLNFIDLLLKNEDSANLGMLYENVISQILVSLGYSLNYFTFQSEKQMKNNSTHKYEIDFLIKKNNKYIPIEVKSSRFNKTRSLDEFIFKFDKYIDKSLIVNPINFKIDDKKIYLPIFFFPFINYLF